MSKLPANSNKIIDIVTSRLLLIFSEIFGNIKFPENLQPYCDVTAAGFRARKQRREVFSWTIFISRFVLICCSDDEKYEGVDCVLGSIWVSVWLSCWQLICRCLQMLRPDNFNLILMSQTFAHESCCNRQEYWYKTVYGVEGWFYTMNRKKTPTCFCRIFCETCLILIKFDSFLTD